jgi:hypothetical protein
MREIGAVEAKNILLDRVERARRSSPAMAKPVARLAPISGRSDPEQAHAAAERIRARARILKLGTFDWELLKADRD